MSLSQSATYISGTDPFGEVLAVNSWVALQQNSAIDINVENIKRGNCYLASRCFIALLHEIFLILPS